MPEADYSFSALRNAVKDEVRLIIPFETVESAVYLKSSPVVRGTWFSLMVYCASTDNGGRIVGGASLPDRTILQLCGVTQDEVREAWPFVVIEGDDIVLPGAKRPERRGQLPSRIGFVYLMENTRNGMTKIGFSNNPSVRENTLQSEEPEVKLLAYWEGTMRDEVALHAEYHEKRVRGEWFALTAEDREAIMEGRRP